MPVVWLSSWSGALCDFLLPGPVLVNPPPWSRVPRPVHPRLRRALNPRETVGWHITGQNEECLVILLGHEEAQIEGQPKMTFVAPRLAYILPLSRHDVANTGKELSNTFTW
jgi:hypothetical protein